MKQKTIPKNGYAFRKAYDSLPRHEQKELRNSLIVKLGINRVTFYNRMKGVIPTHPEYLIIKEVFEQFGINNAFENERSADKQGKRNC